MCGIAGLMTTGGAPDAAVLDRLDAAQLHRGPDGIGRHVAGDTALLQQRLAIIDLSTGDQPFVRGNGLALVGNGEIYNYRELKRDLAGWPFVSQSDCEVPLPLYERAGLGFQDPLRGMYALALADRAGGRLVLARDRFGIKPLYVAETPHGLVFASEPQAIIATGLVAPALRPESVQELLQLQFQLGRETIFAGIRRLLPGEQVVVQGGRVTASRRLPALEPGPDFRTEAEALAAFDAAFADSIDVHRRSDVPYGMFLSGGIDSAAVLAMMARQMDRPVEAFTAYFPGTGAADEREQAKAVAAATGARHHEVSFDEADFLALLPRVAAAMDDAAADYAALPTFKLAGAAREAGIKVALSGEGGDELFAGYSRYRRLLRPRLFGGRAMRAKGPFDALPGLLRDGGDGWRRRFEATADQVRPLAGKDRLRQAQATDMADWLPNDLLVKLDRCLMAHGVEGRTPMLDPAVAAVAWRLPADLKIRARLGKYLLRRWVERHVPAARPFARKQGFTVPVDHWIGKHGARLADLLSRDPGIAAIAEPGAVARLFRDGERDHGTARWRLLFFALWYRRHMLGQRPDGDIFDCLAERP
ncbi:asparagine synthase (glutamine-hydrolyzing) [Zavarzinia compransoris]|uniref:asparagine synthase (glutamine-hydrolyzing) n=1 Tax=Zavarzinia compransoris TaxID=1264899 RepID=A0A317E791_9PROT|nr:asparagine synthase (glutamine-hydrolyzing) [Zavarzinia compransoris]PWR22106.1 asparagine synthase (glutamine-hydrolyzing) [Zavarzinia compransoris]TDP47148.1 asparagine synthase (glutamine-hydrolysing) [Zavarzinia compransoris]